MAYTIFSLSNCRGCRAATGGPEGEAWIVGCRLKGKIWRKTKSVELRRHSQDWEGHSPLRFGRTLEPHLVKFWTPNSEAIQQWTWGCLENYFMGSSLRSLLKRYEVKNMGKIDAIMVRLLDRLNWLENARREQSYSQGSNQWNRFWALSYSQGMTRRPRRRPAHDLPNLNFVLEVHQCGWWSREGKCRRWNGHYCSSLSENNYKDMADTI